MKFKFLFFGIVIGLSQLTFAKRTTPKEYISIYKSTAIFEMNRSGVPASITLAQGMLGSGYGNSELAKNANNHFGIKCHSSWTGAIYRLDDDKKDECFRKYKSVAVSYRDHSDFLRRSRRYAFLFELKISDYKGWCRGLKKAGYATNKRYANLLIDMIERYDLNRFSKKNKFKKGGIKKELITKPIIRENSKEQRNAKVTTNQISKSANWINFIRVKKGDTYYSISKKHSISLVKLYSYNECSPDTILKVGTPIYLQPKRTKGTKKLHLFEEEDNLYRISQQYGIKLKAIFKRNNWKESYIPQEGEKIYLRGRKK